MRLKIGDFTANITAHKFYNERMNINDAKHFLNELAIVYWEAGEYNGKLGNTGLESEFKRKSVEIYEFLKGIGFYD